MPWEKYAATDSAAAGPWAKYAPAGSAAPKTAAAPSTEAAPEPSFLDTLGREAKAAGQSIAGIPGGIYHAFSDQPSAEEQKEFSTDAHPGVIKRGAIGITRMTAEPIANAADWYIKAAQGKIPNAYEQALSVAPEAIGTGAGNVIGGKLIEGAPGAAAGAIEKTPPLVRAAARGANKALATYPKAIGISVGGAVGAATRIPYGAELGAGIGASVGPEILPKIKIPGEGFGLPSRIEGGPAVAPKFVPAAVSGSPAVNSTAIPGTAPAATPTVAEAAPVAAIPSAAATNPSLLTKTGRIKPAVARGLQEQIERGLGNDKPAAAQPIASAPATEAAAPPKLPEGFTPVESSALKGYKYDPAAREFEYITNDGTHYVRGDVAPEAFAHFQKTATDTGSFGKAWHALREHPEGGVGQFKVINGERVAVRKMMPVADLAEQIKNSVEPSQAPKRAPLTDLAKQIKESAKADAKTSANANATIPKLKTAPEGDLTDLLTQSRDNALAAKSAKKISR